MVNASQMSKGNDDCDKKTEAYDHDYGYNDDSDYDCNHNGF